MFILDCLAGQLLSKRTLGRMSEERNQPREIRRFQTRNLKSCELRQSEKKLFRNVKKKLDRLFYNKSTKTVKSKFYIKYTYKNNAWNSRKQLNCCHSLED